MNTAQYRPPSLIVECITTQFDSDFGHCFPDLLLQCQAKLISLKYFKSSVFQTAHTIVNI